jgi:hypothetical protein
LNIGRVNSSPDRGTSTINTLLSYCKYFFEISADVLVVATGALGSARVVPELA